MTGSRGQQHYLQRRSIPTELEHHDGRLLDDHLILVLNEAAEVGDGRGGHVAVVHRIRRRGGHILELL